MLFALFKLAKSKGNLALEQHIENPKNSALFNQFPGFARNHHAVEFVCDYVRLMTLGTENVHEMEALMDEDLETHHNEREQMYERDPEHGRRHARARHRRRRARRHQDHGLHHRSARGARPSHRRRARGHVPGRACRLRLSGAARRRDEGHVLGGSAPTCSASSRRCLPISRVTRRRSPSSSRARRSPRMCGRPSRRSRARRPKSFSCKRKAQCHGQRLERSPHHHQEGEEGRARPSWRRLEDRLCRFRHGDDGFLSPHVAHQHDDARAETRHRGLLRPGKPERDDERRGRPHGRQVVLERGQPLDRHRERGAGAWASPCRRAKANARAMSTARAIRKPSQISDTQLDQALAEREQKLFDEAAQSLRQAMQDHTRAFASCRRISSSTRRRRACAFRSSIRKAGPCFRPARPSPMSAPARCSARWPRSSTACPTASPSAGTPTRPPL